MGGFAIGTAEFASMSLLPFFARDLGIDEPTAGHAISAYALGVVVGAPVIAVLAAKVARRTLLVALMLMFAVGNGLSALAPTYGWLVAFRFLSGLPHGAYFGVAALVAVSLVAPDEAQPGGGARAAGADGRDDRRRPFRERRRAVDRVALGFCDRVRARVAHRCAGPRLAPRGTRCRARVRFASSARCAAAKSG